MRTSKRTVDKVIVVSVALILMIPLIAMQFSSDISWGVGDFLLAGALLLAAGFVGNVAVERIVKRSHAMAVIIVLILVLLYVWAELSVGILTDLGS